MRHILNLLLMVSFIAVHVFSDDDIQQKTRDAITKNRTGVMTIQTNPNATVHVKMLRHEFHFGTALSNWFFMNRNNSNEAKYQSIASQYFNAAVPENALKWHQNYRNPERPNYSIADNILAFCKANNMALRGHCIFWAKPRWVPRWAQEMNDEDLKNIVAQRAREITSRYRGAIEEFDMNNEMIEGHFFRERLGDGIIKDMADWAKEGNPDAQLYVNDYSILSGEFLDRYVAQIEALLEQGVAIGGIGVQGHMGSRNNAKPFDYEKTQHALDRLAKFNLPIEITELDVTQPGDESQAAYLDGILRTCFAHPQVEAIILWGFWERAHWRPQAALWRADWSPKPAADAYKELVFGEWWTDWKGQADENGQCEARAFFGDYSIEVDGQERLVSFSKSENEKTVYFEL